MIVNVKHYINSFKKNYFPWSSLLLPSIFLLALSNPSIPFSLFLCNLFFFSNYRFTPRVIGRAISPDSSECILNVERNRRKSKQQAAPEVRNCSHEAVVLQAVPLSSCWRRELEQKLAQEEAMTVMRLYYCARIILALLPWKQNFCHGMPLCIVAQ